MSGKLTSGLKFRVKPSIANPRHTQIMSQAPEILRLTDLKTMKFKIINMELFFFALHFLSF